MHQKWAYALNSGWSWNLYSHFATILNLYNDLNPPKFCWEEKIQLYSFDLFLILFWLLVTGLPSKHTVYFRADFSPSRLKFQWVSFIPLDCNPKWAMVFYSEYSSWIMMLSATHRNQAVYIWGAHMHTETRRSSCIRFCTLSHTHTYRQMCSMNTLMATSMLCTYGLNNYTHLWACHKATEMPAAFEVSWRAGKRVNSAGQHHIINHLLAEVVCSCHLSLCNACKSL